jgi:hypothetical protein
MKEFQIGDVHGSRFPCYRLSASSLSTSVTYSGLASSMTASTLMT